MPWHWDALFSLPTAITLQAKAGFLADTPCQSAPSPFGLVLPLLALSILPPQQPFLCRRS